MIHVNSDGRINTDWVDNADGGVRFIFQMLTSMMVKIYNKKLWWNFDIKRIIIICETSVILWINFLKQAE